MKQVLDHFQNPLEVGDPITYVGARSNSPVFKRGVVKSFLKSGKVEVLREGRTQSGRTYASRIINMKYIK